jgi:hypothetical protein
MPNAYNCEKVGFIKAGTVKVCLKAGTGRSLGHNTWWFCDVFQKNGGRNQNSCNILGSMASYRMLGTKIVFFNCLTWKSRLLNSKGKNDVL